MRSPLLVDADRVLVHPMLLFALYLLLAGHNRPGGGFVAGLVVAAAVALRARVSGSLEAQRLVRVRPGTLLGGGLLLALAVGIAPLLAGAPLLDARFVSLDLPLFGSVKPTSALLFDVGVAMIVVGVVTAVVVAFLPPAPPGAADGGAADG